MLYDPGYIQDKLRQMKNDEGRKMKSLFEEFISKLSPELRESLMAEDYYIPSMLEVSRDKFCSNPILKCFNVEQKDGTKINHLASIEKILEYMFSRPYSKNQSMIFMEIMPLMLEISESSNEYAKFFLDSPNALINFNTVGSRLTIQLNHPDLPRYSNQPVTINEFTDEMSLSSQTDVNKWMTEYLINFRDIG